MKTLIIKDLIEQTYSIYVKHMFGEYSIISYYVQIDNAIIGKNTVFDINEYSDDDIKQIGKILDSYFSSQNANIILENKMKKFILLKVIIKEDGKFKFKYALDIDKNILIHNPVEKFKLFDDLESAKKYINDSVIELK
jgi:hypothetical protein